MVKEWNPSTWTLSDTKEIFVPKNATLSQVGEALVSRHFAHIPLD
jgi:hypothetical protein